MRSRSSTSIPSSSAVLQRLLVTSVLVVAGLASSTMAQVRVVNWNIARLNGDPQAIEEVFVALAEDDVPGFATAPAVLILQEVTNSARVAVENILADAIPGVPYETATFTIGSSENGSGGAQMLVYRSDLLEEIPAGHRDISTGAGRNTDRWQLRIRGSDDDGGVLWIYGMHLKASTGSSNAEIRRLGAVAIREDADTLPAGSNIVYAGDLNVYGNSEPAYQEFLSAGPGRAEDPLGTGSWSGASNAIKHTQSPRLEGGALVGGGLDDRFDFQLLSPPLFDGDGFSLMPATYRSFGNDGDHYNVSINTGNNTYFPGQTARSNGLADALHDASDHIPVVADLMVPGLLTCVLDDNLGRVVSGGTASVTALIANARDVVTSSAASPLEYSAVGDGILVGGGDGIAPLLPSFDTQSFSLVAGVTGDFTASVEVVATSAGVSQPEYDLACSGFGIRPAVPSWSSGSVVTDLTVEAASQADAGVIFIDVPVHNVGWSDVQSALDLDAASGLGGGFFIWEGLGTSVAGEPGLLRFGFNTAGRSEGTYEVDVTIQATDEDVPGETTHYVTLTLVVTIGGKEPVPGDFNGDGLVNGADLGLLLGAWGPCRGCPEDLNDDGVVNGADLGLELGFWTG